MPVINSKIKTDIIADQISESLKSRGSKVNKKRIRMLIRKLFEKNKKVV